MKNALNSILNIYSNKYFLGPIILTSIFTIILLSPYNSAGSFDLVKSLFSHISAFSALLMALSAHHLIEGKKEYNELFALSLLSLILSLLSIFLFKTHSFLYHFAFVFGVVSSFAFFTILKELVNITKTKK